MEKIGYIEKDKIGLQNGVNSVQSIIAANILFDYRSLVEEREGVVQPICAGVILTKNNQILIVNKTSKSTGKKSPEKNKTLLYVGGHLDDADIKENNLQSFCSGMKREIAEELGMIVDDNNIYNPIVTYSPISEKSAKHFGIIFPIVIEKSFDTTFTDGKCRFVDIENLNNITNFESWSEIILNEVVKKITISEACLDD